MSLAAQSALAVAAALAVVAPGAARAQGFQQNFQAGPTAPGRQIFQPDRSTHIQQQQPRPQQQRQQESQPRPLVEGLVTVTMGSRRYATPDGGVRFVFDRTGARAALLRFDGDDEVHVLLPEMGSRGDEIYRNEDGSIMLRVTAQGGVTVYTRQIRTGAAASELASVAPITPQAVAAAQLNERVRLLQIRAARAVGEPVQFVVPAQMSAAVAGLVVDAAERVAEGLTQAPLTGVRRVVISLGRQPAAALRGEVLYVQVAPEMGYAGRPSSNAIRNVVTGAVQGPQD
ncbi:MAG TPA: DUF4908 domain-containing protein [Terricaulis sp.]|nr:DUF4908 domain-containing protein [Terricaulis sp.]